MAPSSAPASASPAPLPTAWLAAFFVLVLVVFNANGREIGSYDTQSTKFTAWRLATQGDTSLDALIAEVPALGERSGFGRDARGTWRTRYPIVPALMAGIAGRLLHASGLVDLGPRYRANVLAKAYGSTMMALAAVCAAIVASRFTSRRRAMVVATALALGTGWWCTASQTVWQHETAIACAMIALAAIVTADGPLAAWQLASISTLLGLSAAARLQASPVAITIGIGVLVGLRDRRRCVWLLPGVVLVASVLWTNLAWFGHLLGGAAIFETLHENIHGVSGSVANPAVGMAGLLASPSRGLLVFSPWLLVAGLARWTSASPHRALLRLCAMGAFLQLVAYACYSVWWGGHTYGPRYALDALPLFVPLVALGVDRLRRPSGLAWFAVATTWSVLVAAGGAFAYPADAWNTDPADVDRHHERLWDWRDPQFVRAWRHGLSDQDFDFFRGQVLP